MEMLKTKREDKTMKKIFICFLISLFLFTACGKETEVTVQSPEETTAKEESLKKDEIPDVDLITLYKDYVVYEEWGKESVICKAKGDVVRIFDEELEKYPKLENALENENRATADLKELKK